MNRLIPAAWRWALAPAGALALAIGLSIGIAPSVADYDPIGLRNWGRSEYNGVILNLMALRDSATVYRAAWELADTRERAAVEAPAPIGLTVRAEADVPARITSALGEHARSELASLTVTPKHPVIVRLLVDSTVGLNLRRAFVIPASATTPCVVQLRLSEIYLKREELNVRSQLLGVCGLYAKFGAPGDGMLKFLTRTSLATAASHTADVPPSPFQERWLRRGLALGHDPFALGCAVGRVEQCTALFEGREAYYFGWMGEMPSRLPPPRRITNAMRIAVFGGNVYDAGRSSRLAVMRATLGDDRFAMLWASKDEPAVEFARREGRPLEALVSENLRGPSFRYHRGSAPYGLQLLIALVIVSAFAVWGVAKAPREYRP